MEHPPESLRNGGDEPGWPSATAGAVSQRPIVFLLDASSRVERRLLRDWVVRRRPPEVEAGAVDVIRIPPSRRPGHRPADPKRLEARLAAGDDPLLAPLRVAWRPPLGPGGERRARFRDLLLFGDPRDPGVLQQAAVLRRHPERCRVIAGEPALLSELRERWRRAGGVETDGLAAFVERQAGLALERAERRLRGARYKVPRLVHEDILARPSFLGGLARLATEIGRSETSVAREAARDLREIAATHSPTVIDLVAHLFRRLYSLGYGKVLRYDRAQLDSIARLSQRHPVVFLPSHKSNLDHPVLRYALYENGLPPNHTAGGINMNFFPIGPLVRRAGVFFIRRRLADDGVYRHVLRHYIDYLIDKRFSLEWYIEGGRSRSGKLLPPRFGLLAYVVDAYRRGHSDDVFLVPVAIAYDQIQDVGDYVAEQRGAAKARESFGWFLRVVRRLRRRYGNIHIRFGEPLSLAKTLGPPDTSAEPHPDERSLAVQKLAFEVCVRINRVTPITPTSLVTLALLGVGDRALSVEEVRASLRNLLGYVRRRKLPTTEELDLEDAEDVRGALESLRRNGVVTCYEEGPEPVYGIGADQHLAAAYYRNTVIHFFVTGAIAELALLGAAETAPESRRSALASEALRLRDLLKFEFFFAEREVFRAELVQEIGLHDPDWERRLGGSAEETRALLRRFRPLSAHRVLRPFLEAYRVVADALVASDANASLDAAALAASCLPRARQYVLQRRIRSPESVSKVLFGTAIRLAENRRLLSSNGENLAVRRRAFADEIDEAIHRIDVIDALAAARRAGIFD